MQKTILLLLIILGISCFGQENADVFFNEAAKDYYYQDFKKCKENLNKGLGKFPENKKLKKLKDKLSLTLGEVNHSPGPEKPVGDAEPKEKVGSENVIEVNPKPPVIIVAPKTSININFNRVPGENKMTWSEELSKIAEEIKIKYDADILREYDVTNSSSHYYSPGTSDAQGVKTKVELYFVIKDEYKDLYELKGSRIKLNELFKCK
jgi:hypothetical protein